MIGFLRGKVINPKPTKILIDVNGVGYSVNISIQTFEEISGNENISLFIYTSVKEDSITLFGFSKESEKELFELLISVNGIGPRTALGILSGIRTDQLKEAIYKGDISLLSSIPGIGKKTSERLVLELRNKIDNISDDIKDIAGSSVKNEAVLALTTLGYNSKLADKTVRDLLSIEPSSHIEDIIKKALAKLNQN